MKSRLALSLLSSSSILLLCPSQSNAEGYLSIEDIPNRFHHISWDGVEMDNGFLGYKETSTDASIEIPGNLSHLEITESGKIIAVLLNAKHAAQSNLNSIGYISGGKEYNEIAQFTFDRKQSENLGRLKLQSCIEGITMGPRENLFLQTNNHIIQCPTSATHRWTRSTRAIFRIKDIECTDSMPDSLFILETHKTGDWQDKKIRLHGEWNGEPSPSYPEAKQVFEARVAKRSLKNLRRENDEYSVILCGDDFRGLSFCFLDRDRMLILLKMAKPELDPNWNLTIQALVLIDKNERGFYLVKGMDDITIIDANQTGKDHRFYGFSKNNLRRYQLQD